MEEAEVPDYEDMKDPSLAEDTQRALQFQVWNLEDYFLDDVYIKNGQVVDLRCIILEKCIVHIRLHRWTSKDSTMHAGQ